MWEGIESREARGLLLGLSFAWALVSGCGGASSPELDGPQGPSSPALDSSAEGSRGPVDTGGKPAAEPSSPAPQSHERAYDDLRVVAPTKAPGLAPVRMAANGLYPGKVSIDDGGVDELCSDEPGAELAIGSEMDLLRTSADPRCSNLRVLFTVCEGVYRIVAKRSSGIQSVEDLADKHVMVPHGSSSHYFLTQIAAEAELELGDGPGQIHVVDGTPDGHAFGTEEPPDAVAIWEPGAQLAADALGEDAVSLQLDGQGYQVYRELFNLHATVETLENPDKRRAIVRFVRALADASLVLQKDPSAAFPLLTGPAGVSEAVLTKSFAYQRFAGTLVGDVSAILGIEESWLALVEGREPRPPEQLWSLVDSAIYLAALWPEQTRE